VTEFAREAGVVTRFVGYETTEVNTSVAAASRRNGSWLMKFAESPFYPEGGGQVSDAGLVESESAAGRVDDVYRLGDDQAVAVTLERGELKEGDRVRLMVDRQARHATAANHTATHLLHAALRQRLGTHVRQAGSAVRPDKLRFDFTHGTPMSAEEMRDVEDQVNAWILESRPVRALHTTRARAEELGAMALFGEKYGDEVRMIEVDGVSRELCGGTHVGTTSEVGVFKLLGEGSSAANVRRIEAVTGPAAVELLRERDAALTQIAGVLRVRPEQAVLAVEGHLAREADLERDLKAGGAGRLEELAASLLKQAEEVGGVKVLSATCEGAGAEELRELSDRLKGLLGESAVVLGSAENGRPVMVASFTGGAVERGLSAAEIVKEAARLMGGGGGGRDTMAQAGGKNADKLDDALAAARKAIETKLAGPD
jgi:alanyl-tRNA synthetase